VDDILKKYGRNKGWMEEVNILNKDARFEMGVLMTTFT
jgi:hypothetical protein